MGSSEENLPHQLESKVLLYKTIIEPIWTYGIELWGCASKSHIAKMQRSQSKILRTVTNAPRYVTNQTLHDDLKVPFIKDVLQGKSINHTTNWETIVILYCSPYWNSNKEEG
jgi:hypothetical protein